MKLSALREAPLPDGTPGPFSIRRILATFFALSVPFLFALAFRWSNVGWWVFIPGAAAIVACLLLCFFTTWADVAAVISAAKGAP